MPVTFEIISHDADVNNEDDANAAHERVALDEVRDQSIRLGIGGGHHNDATASETPPPSPADVVAVDPTYHSLKRASTEVTTNTTTITDVGQTSASNIDGNDCNEFNCSYRW